MKIRQNTRLPSAVMAAPEHRADPTRHRRAVESIGTTTVRVSTRLESTQEEITVVLDQDLESGRVGLNIEDSDALSPDSNWFVVNAPDALEALAKCLRGLAADPAGAAILRRIGQGSRGAAQ